MFDIHTYGRELINKLDNLGGFDSPVLFSEAVSEHPSYEICRYFVSGLQLVCTDIPFPSPPISTESLPLPPLRSRPLKYS